MKKKRRFFDILAAGILFFVLVFAGCPDSDKKNNGTVKEFNVTASDFYSTLESIKNMPGTYTFNLSGDVIDFPGFELSKAGVNIIVKGKGNNKITWKRNGDTDDDLYGLFTVTAGKLVLEDIKLERINPESYWGCLLFADGGTIEMKTGVILDNLNDQQHSGAALGGGSFIMSGGIIRNSFHGIQTFNSDAVLTITGGEIIGGTHIYGGGISIGGERHIITITGVKINNAQNAVGIGFHEAVDCKLYINGGEISNNKNGIALSSSSGCEVTITDGDIINNSDHTVAIWDNSTNCKLTIAGGKINDNGGNGVFNGGNGTIITVSGGEISNNGEWGIGTFGENCKLIIRGGVISKNEGWGVAVGGKNNEFSKEQGGIIYGNNSGDNSNGVEWDGAITINWRIFLRGDAGLNDVLFAEIDADGEIEESSLVGGDWEWAEN